MKKNLLLAVAFIILTILLAGKSTFAEKAVFSDPNVAALHDTVEGMRAKAAKGDPEAQTGLGMIGLYGFGGKQDMVAAKNWFEKAATQDYPEAIVQLGNLYENGAGVEQDAVKAGELYRKAIKLNYPQGSFRLGMLYINGLGVAKDEAEGDKLLQAACDGGYRTSCGVQMWRANKIAEARAAFDQQCQTGDLLACGFLNQIPPDMAGAESQPVAADKGKGGFGLYLIIGLVLIGLLLFWLIRNDPGDEEGKAG